MPNKSAMWLTWGAWLIAVAVLSGYTEPAARAVGVEPRAMRVSGTLEQGDPVVARNALLEANAALNAAIRSRDYKTLLKAINDANELVDNIATLNLAVLRADILVTARLIWQAQGRLLTVLNDDCLQRGQFEHGLLAALVLRRLSETSRAGIGEPLLAASRARLGDCLTFKLLISSLIKNDDIKYLVQVDVAVTLAYNLETGNLTGAGEIKKVAQRLELQQGCTTQVLPFTPKQFVVRTMGFKLTEEADELRLADIELSGYDPGAGLEQITMNCPNGAFPTTFFNWGLAYLGVHTAQQNVTVKDWALAKPANAIASRTYDQSMPRGKLTESTNFILMHAPKPGR